jgi:hypothetical protein
VRRSLGEVRAGTLRRGARMWVQLGLTAVAATQLWHHTFLGGELTSLPSLARGAA